MEEMIVKLRKENKKLREENEELDEDKLDLSQKIDILTKELEQCMSWKSRVVWSRCACICSIYSMSIIKRWARARV